MKVLAARSDWAGKATIESDVVAFELRQYDFVVYECVSADQLVCHVFGMAGPLFELLTNSLPFDVMRTDEKRSGEISGVLIKASFDQLISFLNTLDYEIAYYA